MCRRKARKIKHNKVAKRRKQKNHKHEHVRHGNFCHKAIKRTALWKQQTVQQDKRRAALTYICEQKMNSPYVFSRWRNKTKIHPHAKMISSCSNFVEGTFISSVHVICPIQMEQDGIRIFFNNDIFHFPYCLRNIKYLQLCRYSKSSLFQQAMIYNILKHICIGKYFMYWVGS